MQKVLRRVLVWGIVVIFVGLVLHAPLMVFLTSRFPEGKIFWQSWKEILMVLLGAVAGFLLVKGRGVGRFFRSKLVRTVAVYGGLLVVMALVSLVFLKQPVLSVLSGVLIDGRYLLFMLVVMAAVWLEPGSAKLFMRGAMVGAAIVVVFGVLQVTVLPDDFLAVFGYGPETIQPFQLIDDNPEFVRAQSTLRGPNVLGAYSLMAVFLFWFGFRNLVQPRTASPAPVATGRSRFSLGLPPSETSLWTRLRKPLRERQCAGTKSAKKGIPQATAEGESASTCDDRLGERRPFVAELGVSAGVLAAITCLYFSYSRGAWLGAGVAAVVLVVFWLKSHRKWIKAVVGTGVVLLVVLGGLLFAFRDSSFVANIFLHDDAEVGAEVSSNEEHLESLQTGLRRLATQPFGAGVGSTGSASLYSDSPVIIENQYLFVAHELGWMGLALFVYILFRLFTAIPRKSCYFAVAVATLLGLLVIGFFLPVFADETVAMTLFGLIGCIVAGVPSRAKTMSVR